ncbi:MAG: 4-hydroxythreonine-4-phosphate dehydrogenase PdxA [Pseudomonadota bacterium]
MIGITIGDPLGIGPEIVEKVLDHLPPHDRSILKIYGEKKGRCSDKTAAKIALDALDAAIEDAKQNKILAIVTAPVNKARMKLVNSGFVGHTEYLAQKTKTKDVTMLFAPLDATLTPLPPLSIVTRHIPLKDVSKHITKDAILKALDQTKHFLSRYEKKFDPKLAILALNPHAGDKGSFGDEEISIIKPAIDHANAHGITCEGPFSSDAFFAREAYKDFDGIIALYHDQGLIPVKILGQGEIVNVTLGLPFVRTSPSHGTADDIAGQNKASYTAMLNAIKMAVKLCDRG